MLLSSPMCCRQPTQDEQPTIAQLNDKASATTPSLKGVGLGEEVGDKFTEENGRLALKKRKEEEAALAAQVEAELLNEDIGAIDLDDLDLDADLERAERGGRG